MYYPSHLLKSLNGMCFRPFTSSFPCSTREQRTTRDTRQIALAPIPRQEIDVHQCMHIVFRAHFAPKAFCEKNDTQPRSRAHFHMFDARVLHNRIIARECPHSILYLFYAITVITY